MDDDFWGFGNESGYPSNYQDIIDGLKRPFDNYIRDRVSKIVSPSPQILSRFPDLQTLRLDPMLIYRLPPLDHHDDTDKRLDVSLCATRWHLPDLEMICDELSKLLNAHRQIHLTTFFGGMAPKSLQLDNCTHHRRLPWANYRRTVETLRFHVGIAPWRDTVFNRGRSCTRILDHAVFGAAGLYSAIPPFSDRIDHGHDGILVDPKPGAWAEVILELANDRKLCRRLAVCGQEVATRIGDPARVRDFWCTQLGL